MKEIKYTPTQRKFIRKLYDMLSRYYVKGNTHYTTLMGYKLDMRDCINLLDTIIYNSYYTPSDKEQLNEIRSMYISLTHNVS